MLEPGCFCSVLFVVERTVCGGGENHMHYRDKPVYGFFEVEALQFRHPPKRSVLFLFEPVLRKKNRNDLSLQGVVYKLQQPLVLGSAGKVQWCHSSGTEVTSLFFLPGFLTCRVLKLLARM